ncbi:MAG: glycosyltransferase family 2 protein [Acidobacteriota bacterium]|nr:glycosyltransferase family 2 protein [Acidobacteriota bacterium]MDH3528259.1 glycosyltransferase family 2 protein [Acidobacteriota bacterium]
MALEIALKTVFVAALFALLYTYAGYPLLVFLIARLFRNKSQTGDFEPTVTVLITAFNEEGSLKRKLENTLQIDYPIEKLDVLVASDGSTDATDRIVTEFGHENVRLFRQEGRKGKTFTQNKAVEVATGEIILFSDATTEYQPDVLRKLVPWFADPAVGCAAGRLVYLDPSDSDVGRGARSYWSYETFLKRNESDACSLIGASGCLYAVRREAYQPMYPEACSDFLICTVLFEKGLRSVYVPEAVCFEETNRRSGHELRMRIRVISQTISDLWRNRRMLNPFKSGFYAIQLFSHKVMRYMIPLFLLMLFLSSLLLSPGSRLFQLALVVQTLFYAVGLIGWFLERRGMKTGVLSVFIYFVITCYASVIGFYKFLMGENYASWEPIRDESATGTNA